MIPRVAGLFRYIVKGCAPEELATAHIGTQGIDDDRRFMLVDADDGTFVSQRTNPNMAVLVPRLRDHRLTVTAPDSPPLDIPTRTDGPRRPVSLFDRWFGEGVDQGDRAAEWFSQRLGKSCRLVRTPPGFDRDGWGAIPGKVGFADAHAILLCSVSSLDELNARIVAGGSPPIPMNRFRPNIVVAGWAEPHVEDRARTVRIGGVELAHAVRCIRCTVPTVDQATGRSSGPEPTRTLAGYRREPGLGGGVSFGVKLAVSAPGELARGDVVDIRDWVPEGFVPPRRR